MTKVPSRVRGPEAHSTAPVNLDDPFHWNFFFFFSSSVWDMKITILLGYWKIFLLEIWVLVPIAQNLKNQMQILCNTVRKWDPHEFSLDLNPAWIQKQVIG